MPLPGQLSAEIYTEGFQVARQDFHCRNAAGLNGRHEVGALVEGKIGTAPQAKALGIGKIFHRGRAGRRDVEDASLRQRMLYPRRRGRSRWRSGSGLGEGFPQKNANADRWYTGGILTEIKMAGLKVDLVTI